MRFINYSQPFWINLRAKINCHNNFSRQRTWAQSEAQSRRLLRRNVNHAHSVPSRQNKNKLEFRSNPLEITRNTGTKWCHAKLLLIKCVRSCVIAAIFRWDKKWLIGECNGLWKFAIGGIQLPLPTHTYKRTLTSLESEISMTIQFSRLLASRCKIFSLRKE